MDVNSPCTGETRAETGKMRRRRAGALTSAASVPYKPLNLASPQRPGRVPIVWCRPPALEIFPPTPVSDSAENVGVRQ